VYRFLGPALGATLLLSACKIERTPREQLSQREPAATERRLAEEELRDRVGALAQAVGRGDHDAALLALAPAADLYLQGPDDGPPAVGPEGAAAVVRALIGEEAPEVAVEDVRVTLGPRARVAWVAATMDVRGEGEAERRPLRMTGVYLRVRGAWVLSQGHLSRPATGPEAPQPLPADSAAPRDSTATKRGGA